MERDLLKSCSVSGCSDQVKARGWCHKHYSRWWRTGSVESNGKAPTTCTECDKTSVGLNLCRNHYARWIRTGRPQGVDGDLTYISERRVTEKHTMPSRPWLRSDTEYNAVVHMQSWVLVSGIRKLVAGCSLRLPLLPGESSEEPIMCLSCVRLLKQHGLIAS